MTKSSVTYLDTADAVTRFLAGLGSVRTLALDTEGASFHRFVDRIYLLQLSTREAHAILDPLPIGAPERLGALLQDPAVEVVFHDADYDLRLLHQDYGWHVRRIFDTRIAAQLLGIKAFGLAALLDAEFGVKLDKKHQRADWSMRPLTEGMLDYAAQDTMHLLGLRDVLAQRLEQKGRWAWAEEEFQRLEGTRWPVEEPGTAFLRVKGARDLTRRELAVLRELVPWRDGVARSLDRSTFRVVGNDVLLLIAQQQPRTVQALGAIKGFPRGMLDRGAEPILSGVERALSLPDAELPKFPKGMRWDRDPDFDSKVSALRTVRDEHARRLELDPGVLGSRERLETIARLAPRAVEQLAEVSELRRWQIEVMGADLVKALRPWVDKPARAAKDESPYLE